MLPTTALRHGGAILKNEKYICESKAVMSFRSSVSHGLTDIRNPTVSAKRLFASSRQPLAVQCLCSNVFIACCLHSLVCGRCRRYGGQVALPQRAAHLLVCLNRTKNVGLRDDDWVRSTTNEHNTATTHNETRKLSPRTDDHKILLMLMPRVCGVMALIGKPPLYMPHTL